MLYFLCLVALVLIFKSGKSTSGTSTVFYTLVITWLLVWMAVGRLLAWFRLRYLGLWGALIHALYIYSEMLYQQPLSLSLSPGALVSLAGIGVVLLPLGSRFTRFMALPLFVVATIALVSFPLMNIGNFWLTGAPLDDELINAILQTHLSEALQFLGSSYSPARLMVVFGSIALCIGFILWKLTTANAAPYLAGLGLLLLLPTAVNLDKAPDYLHTLGYWKETTVAYNRTLKDWWQLEAQRAAMVSDYNLENSSGDRVTVLVIGESHNKRHMSLYGYPRDNTPQLERLASDENLIVFENAWSNHTHTVPTLTLALTEANQDNGKKWNAVPSLLQTAREAGLQTWWLSNQSMLGIWDTPVAALAREADHVISINDSIGTRHAYPDRQDEALLPYLQEALQQPGEKLIVVHLYGNHGSACLRYPTSWETWSAELELSVFGKASATPHLDAVNCYDNSVLYNDFVLGRIFDSLEKSDLPAAAFYFADHSEEIFNGKAHNSGNFDFAMADIPMVFTASDSWKRTYPEQYRQLLNNKKNLFTNDLVFETMLGLMGLRSARIDTRNDLGSEDYESSSTPKTLHGRISLKDNDNNQLWQRTNAHRVNENKDGERLLPHRVNTIGKNLEIHKAGVRSFEVDVLFRHAKSGEGGGYFEVGRGEQAMRDMSLEKYLQQIPPDFEKIWLDIKNATTATIPQITSRLLELDEKTGLKERAIIETRNESAAPYALSKSGFHLSYYLPTRETLSAMGGDHETRQKLATKLAAIAEKQEARAVSFDLQLYRFVKDYLEPKLAPQTVYHTWTFDHSFSNPALLEDLRAESWFHDSAVKTILLPWLSPFDL